MLLDNVEGFAKLFFSLNVYSLETIKKAAYKFTDKASFDFITDKKDTIEVRINAIVDLPSIELDRLAKQFNNEVLDQDLRGIIASQTEATRNLILAQAFSRTDLLNNE